VAINRLDHHAFEGARARFGADRSRNLGKRLHGSIGIANAQSDSADVGLVENGVGVELDCDRKAERLCAASMAACGVIATRVGTLGISYAYEEPGRFYGAEDRPALGSRLCEHRADGSAVGSKLFWQGRRRLEECQQVRVVTPRVIEDPHRVVREAEGRNSGSFRHVGPVRHAGTAHPPCKDRLARQLGEGRHPLRDLRSSGARLRRERDEDSVVARVSRGDFDRFGKVLGRSVAVDVDRVGTTPERSQ
jgi:hypothetical protein